MTQPFQLKADVLATFDSLDGAIPVKVLRVGGPPGPPGRQPVDVEVTATVGPHRQGTTIRTCALWVIPAGANANNYVVR